MDEETLSGTDGVATAEPRARLVLSVSMFVMGGCGLVYEYVLSVLGNYLIGSSHEEIFIIIGLMMFAMGTGSFLQQKLEGHLIDKFLGMEIALGVVGGFSASLVHIVFAVSESYRIVLYSVAFVIGCLIGMEIPVLIRINRRYAASLRTNLSEILSMDYVGALAGALIFTYVLLVNVSLSRIGLILGLANVAVAGIGYLYFRALVHRPVVITGLLVISVVALVIGFFSAPGWDAWAEQKFFADPIVYRETTPYQHIVLTKRKDVVNLYLNGHLQFSSRDEKIYHDMLVHPAMTLAASRRRVLVLGGGDGLAVRECLKYDDVDEVTLVDIDPGVTRLAATHPLLVALNEGALRSDRVRVLETEGVEPTAETYRPSFRSQRPTRRLSGDREPLTEVHVFHVDADIFLRRATGKYDVVILDFPDPSRLEVAKLYSRSFYRFVKERMAPTGILAVQSTSPYHARLVFLCIGETLRSAGFSVLPYHQTVPSFGSWGFHLAVPQPDHETSLSERLRARPALRGEATYVTPDLLSAATVFGRAWLEPRPGEAPVRPNTRMQPVILEYHRKSWDVY